MLAVLEAAFPRWPPFGLDVAPIDHLRWKLEGPPGRPGLALLADIGGQLAGLSVILARRFLARGVVRSVEEQVDVATHPAFQGVGVHREKRRVLTGEVHPRFDLRLGASRIAHMEAYADRMGNQPFGSPVVPHRKLYRPWRPASWRPRNARLLAGALVPRRRTRSGVAAAVRTGDRFDGRADGLFKAAATAFDLVQVRDAGYLNWRYADPRAGRYTLLQAEEGDRLLGYAVFKIERHAGQIVDLLVLPGREDVLDALLAAADRALREAGAEHGEVRLTAGHLYAAAVRSCGFAASVPDTSYNYRALALPAEEVAFLAEPGVRIHLTAGDSDWV